MKEQISVDKQFSNKEINIIRQWFNSLENVNPNYLIPRDFKLYKKIMDLLGDKIRPCHDEIIAEYERLKRLYENVQEQINRLKEQKEGQSNYIQNLIKLDIENLENFYK